MADPKADAEAPESVTGSSSNEDGTPGKHSGEQDLSGMNSPSANVEHNHSTEPSSAAVGPSREGTPPPLPPRPMNLHLLDDRPNSSGSLRVPSPSKRPSLQSKPTTALSLADIQSHSDSSKDTRSSPTSKHVGFKLASFGLPSRSGSEADDSASVRSYTPALDAGGDADSILGDVLIDTARKPWRPFGQSGRGGSEEELFTPNSTFDQAFEHEFNEIDSLKSDSSNEEAVMVQFRAKLKHFLILSSAGKPVYSRHGDDQVISNYIGVIQTIISFHQDTKDELKCFTASDVRFVIMSRGFLNLVAISRLGESEAQLRSQLEALYMQILSTLTLPNMERMFSHRPSTDLRRPLQGTEILLSALADGFTRGSPSTLLSALECLKLRKSHRQLINNTLLKVRTPKLLYGLIVANGRLVSVVRPKKHSLHPGDLQLIFNMLFEAGSVKAGEGENWIPLCLPGFNNTGYLYMYVSFLNLNKIEEETGERPSTASEKEEEVAIIFISTDKESFYELRQMRDDLVEQLRKNSGLETIRVAVKSGRPSCVNIIPGTPLRHFLYKSRGNVQFTMPSFDHHFSTPISRRKLLNLYHSLHARLHSRPTALKIHHTTSTTNISLAWSTPLFELYCIAPASTPRPALAQAANKIIEWVRREEERLFIIGGAVF